MSLVEDKARGQRAEALLKDEDLRDGLKELQYAAHRAFEASGGEPEKLLRAWLQWQAAVTFKGNLARAVSHGSAAAKEIDAELQGGRFVRGIGRLVRNRDPVAEEMPWKMAR